MSTDDSVHKHDLSIDRTQEHISKKVYMFPDSYNALRVELHDYWPTLWNGGAGYLMAFDGPAFIELMNQSLDLMIQFDSDNVDGMCKKILDELRVKRGMSRLHQEHEYRHNYEQEQQIRQARADNEVAPWHRRT